jgi:hypothetical protein
MSCRDDGAPVPVYKDSNGRYHCPGSLSVITSHMIKKVLNTLGPVLDILKQSKIKIVSPIRRYVSSKCCDDDSQFWLEGPAKRLEQWP